jgi:predicted dehydrogenase
MSPTHAVTRRDAFRRGAAALGTIGASACLPCRARRALARPWGANERIRVGVIGTGVRGKYLIGNLPEPAHVTAICDCATSRMADTLAPQPRFASVLASFRDHDASRCTTYQDYRRMVDREALDAVIIATPDHHHAQAAMLALEAGLDVYLEKPLTVTIGEGRLLADMVRKRGRVLQVGSQQRTMEMNRFACEFVRDGGIGKVRSVDFPNYPGPLRDPEFPAESVPAGLDWDLFLGPTRRRPHHRRLWVKDDFTVDDLLWRGWDLFREYSGHLMTNWGAHSIDMVQYALGMDDSGPVKITPVQVASHAALERDWREKWREKTPYPDQPWERAWRFRPVVLEYAAGTVLHLKPGVDAAVFHGERGRITISRNRYRTDPPDLAGAGPDPRVAEKWRGVGFVARPHLQNWLDCLRDRNEPHAPVEVGHRTVTVCHLVNIARELNRPLRWDPVNETFPGDPEACALLDRPRRTGWQLPAIA